VFLRLGLLIEAELDAVLVSEFNPVRMGFAGRAQITTRDVLNCGASPARLLETLRRRFLDAGGWGLPPHRLSTLPGA
jgi:lycopene cyclase CruP